MGERTEISWTNHTFNPWVGCTKVSAACDHCYAETWAKRIGQGQLWQGERRRTSEANWREPFKWDRAAKLAGERRRVFCASLADVFDNQAHPDWRADLWAVIADTPNLYWLLLTKRPQNIEKMLPGSYVEQLVGRDLPEWPWPNVWLGTTAENQEEYDRRQGHLAMVEAAVHFISYEPALGPLSIAGQLPIPDWIICGGESGARHRPMDLNWARDLRDECVERGVAFHFKQFGGNRPKDGGCLLDGREWKEFPVDA